jgi:superfamily II DNA or RNA helicase
VADSILDYAEFIRAKALTEIVAGFDPQGLGPHLFDFQAAIVDWACKRGRAAIFADTGLGKTAMQAEWARQVAAHTGGRVLILAPLCVAQQTVEEESKFGTAIKYCRKESQTEGDIIITNYEMVEHFDIQDYAGVVLDESSILKSHDSKTRAKIIEMFGKTPYRLSCTATPSSAIKPNSSASCRRSKCSPCSLSTMAGTRRNGGSRGTARRSSGSG